jgi:pantoate kinase
MIGKAFAPAHITGFFSIFDDEDPLKMGSCGCGMALEDGVTTTAQPAEATETILNGVTTEAPTTRTIIEMLTEEPVRVESKLAFPIGGGFGDSGAGAFSTALALNEALHLNRTYNDLAFLAHVAEVKNRTGLGDVAGMYAGGIVMRLKPGTPFILDRIPVVTRDIYCVYFGPVSTKSVLTDPKEKAKINESGKKCLKTLLKKPTFDQFMKLSREFSVETGLISEKALAAVKSVEANGGMASMAMLGDAVFATTDKGLAEFGEVKKTRIGLVSAHPI